MFRERGSCFQERLCVRRIVLGLDVDRVISAFDEHKEVEGKPEHRSRLVQTFFSVWVKWHMQTLDDRG